MGSHSKNSSLDKAIPKSKLVMRSLMIAFGLTVLKTTVGILTNSIAILATAVDSLMDFIMSLVNFFFIRSAEKPADINHPYGHGKMESFAGLVQSLLMGLITLGLAGATVHRFIHPKPVEQPGAGIAIIVFAILVNAWHVRNLRKSMMATGSQIMATEYVHYASDFLSHLGVVASIILFQITGFLHWDPIMSVLIVIYLVYSVAQIFNSSLGELLDEQLPKHVLADIQNTILNFHPCIIDFHDMKTRKVGDTRFIEFHVELRNIDRFDEAHKISEDLTDKLKSMHPKSQIIVHADPEGAE